MSSSLQLMGFGIVLVLVQLAAALPWVAVLNRDLINRAFTWRVLPGSVLLMLIVPGAVAGLPVRGSCCTWRRPGGGRQHPVSLRPRWG